MFLSIILLLTNLPTVLILRFFYGSEFRANNANRPVLMVKVLPEMLSDSEFERIKNGYKLSVRRVFLMTLLLMCVSIVLLNTTLTHYVSTVTPLMLFPMFFSIYMLNRAVFRARRRLLRLKERFRVIDEEEERVLYVDLLTSRLKNERAPSAVWFFVPFLLNTVLWFWGSHSLMKSLIVVSYFVTGVSFLVFKGIMRMPAKMYSADSQKNLILNQVYRQKWSTFYLNISIASALFHLLLGVSLIRHLESFQEISPIVFYIALLLIAAVSLLYPLRVYRSFKELEARMLENECFPCDAKCDELNYVEDGFWGLQYCNPNNPAVFVNAAVGIGQTINIGNRKGKIIHYGSKLIFYLAMLSVIGIGLFEDIAYPKMEVSEHGIRVYQTLYPYKVDAEDIVAIEMTESAFQKGDLYKVNGTATELVLRGDFQLSQVGKVKVYTWKRADYPKIVLYLKNHEFERLYFSADTADETRKLFEILNTYFPEKGQKQPW